MEVVVLPLDQSDGALRRRITRVARGAAGDLERTVEIGGPCGAWHRERHEAGRGQRQGGESCLSHRLILPVTCKPTSRGDRERMSSPYNPPDPSGCWLST